MTDMMIGLVFIFIIMLMYFALQASKQTDAATAALTQLDETQQELTAQLEAARLREEEALAREAEAIRQREVADRALAEALARDEAARLAYEQAERAFGVAEAARADLQQRLADLEEINRRLAAIAGIDEARGRLLRDLEARLADRGVNVEVIPEQGILRLGRDVVLFDTNSATPTANGRNSLNAIAAALAEVLPCYSETFGPVAAAPQCDDADSGFYRIESVYIEGHTDDQPIAGGGNYVDNLALSADRAATSYRILMQQAPILGQLCRTEQTSCQPILGVSGYGEHRPVADNTIEEGRGANRRIDFRIIMATPDLERLQADIDRELAPLP